MSLLKRKKTSQNETKPEIIYPNEFRRQLCTQAQLTQELISAHLKGNKILLDKLKIKTDKLRQIYIVGNSSYYPLAIWASHNFEVICDVHSSPYLLSELECSEVMLDKKTLVILLCSHEEAKGTLERVKKAKAEYLFIDDHIDKESKLKIPIGEFTLKYIMLSLIALYIGRKNQILTELYYKLAINSLKNLRANINDIMKNESYILSIADGMYAKDMIITGRNVDYATAMYIADLFSYALGCDVRSIQSGELEKIINKSNVIAIASNDNFYSVLPDENYSVKIAPLSCSDSSNSICFQGTLPLFNPLLCAIIGQIIAYGIIYNT